MSARTHRASGEPAPLVRTERGFQTGLAIAFLATALIGFAPTYYLRALHQAAPLSPLLHVHGLAFTSWLVLLLVQSALVGARRVDLRRRLGMGGAALAAVMVPLGMTTAIEAARRGVSTPGLDPLVFMIFPFGSVVMFAGLIGAALWKRRDRGLHRRLVTLATVVILTPAIARLPFVGLRPVLALVLSTLFVAAAMLHDYRTERRVHPVYAIGGLALLLSGPLRFALGHTEAWQSFAHALIAR
jgi:hypothetical protein